MAPRLRLAQRRLAAAARADEASDLDAVTGDAPAALIAKDDHSLWLNSAALALAGGDLEVAGRRRRARRARRADRRPARGGGVAVPGAPPDGVADDEYVDGDARRRLKLAAARGVTAVHDKDGWLGALRLWQQLEARAR